MEEEQRRGIGKRLWDLRENSPETNRSIGDAVGVSERTVAEWVAGRQGMTYDHATELARFFDVDLDWFWRGKETRPTPDVLAALSPTAIDELREKLDQVLDQQVALLAAFDALRDDLADQRKPQAPDVRTPGASRD